MTNVAALISILTTTNLEPVVSFEPVTNLQTVIRQIHVLHYQGISNVVFATNWVHRLPVAPQQAMLMPLRYQPGIRDVHHYHTNTVTNKVIRFINAPMPPMPGALDETPLRALKSMAGAMAPAPQPTVTVTNWKRITQVWLSRGTNAMPSIRNFIVARQFVLPASAPHGTIHVLPTDPFSPGIWVESDWTGTPYGNLMIQMATNPIGPWIAWASVQASQWVYDPNGVLAIGWQTSDDSGRPYPGHEFMRLLVTPP